MVHRCAWWKNNYTHKIKIIKGKIETLLSVLRKFVLDLSVCVHIPVDCSCEGTYKEDRDNPWVASGYPVHCWIPVCSRPAGPWVSRILLVFCFLLTTGTLGLLPGSTCVLVMQTQVFRLEPQTLYTLSHIPSLWVSLCGFPAAWLSLAFFVPFILYIISRLFWKWCNFSAIAVFSSVTCQLLQD